MLADREDVKTSSSFINL